VAAHNEDTEQELTSTEELAAEATQQNLTGVSQVLNVGVAFTHETNVVSGVGSKETEADNQDDTGNQAKGSDSARQGQDTERDRLANHEETTLPKLDQQYPTKTKYKEVHTTTSESYI
jgi:hypothetical protein